MLSFFMSEDAGSSSAIRGITKDSTLGALESDIQCQSQRSVTSDSLNLSFRDTLSKYSRMSTNLKWRPPC